MHHKWSAQQVVLLVQLIDLCALCVVNYPMCRHHFIIRVLDGVFVYTLCLLSLQMGTPHGTSLFASVLHTLRHFDALSATRIVICYCSFSYLNSPMLKKT